jgi:hypothetical protein
MKQTIDKQQMIKLLVANETEHSDPEVMTDMRDLRNGLVTATETFTSSRCALGAAMYRYHEVIEHGKWEEVLRILSWATGAFERTLREILKDYTRVMDKPESVKKDMQRRGLDPAAKRNATIIEMASAKVEKGADPVKAVQAALDNRRADKTEARKVVSTKRRLPSANQYPGDQYFEVAIERFCNHMLNTLEKVPKNVRVEAWKRASARALCALTDQRDPITVIPSPSPAPKPLTLKSELGVVNG